MSFISISKFKSLALIFVFTVVTSNAFAFPLPRGNQQELSIRSTKAFKFLNDLEAQKYNFEGIVKLSNCSGSLIRYENSKETDLALILTNGHCLDLDQGFLDPGQVIYNQPMERSFGLYNASAEIVGRLTSTHIVYGTMTLTDMSIYRLNETYADIKAKYNVSPLVLSSNKASPADPIEVISGYWKKGYSCSIEKFVGTLLEDAWTFKDSIRYTEPGCDTIGGTSGSPIINPVTRQVVGVNNTSNEDGQVCTMNNPCEVDENGNKKAYQGISYGQQTYWVYSCLTEANEINLLKEGCLLPR
ncbi:MAG: trypsin-like peptidase domain-containing protein [Bdellovibrionota bacterium]